MGAPSYYLLSALAPLDPPGLGRAPLSLSRLLSQIWSPRPRELVRAVLLSDDLRLREATMAGELRDPEPAVLTPEQVRGEGPLPFEDTPRLWGSDSSIPSDVVWRGYYRYAAGVAERLASPLLAAWVAYDVAVRNALAAARARALGLEPRSYRVASELERRTPEVDSAVALWTAAADPLAGMRALIGARWRWIHRYEPRYTFQDDEFVAYAAKLVLLHRWDRTERASGRTRQAAGEAGG
ncbi:MAG: hypothetical protein ACOC3J_04860 [Gemmatimonadota bacterium]